MTWQHPSQTLELGEKGVRPGKGAGGQCSFVGDSAPDSDIGTFKFSLRALCFTPTCFWQEVGKGW